MFECIKLTGIDVWGETPSKIRVDNFLDTHMRLIIGWIVILTLPSPKLKVPLSSLTPCFSSQFREHLALITSNRCRIHLR